MLILCQANCLDSGRQKVLWDHKERILILIGESREGLAEDVAFWIWALRDELPCSISRIHCWQNKVVPNYDLTGKNISLFQTALFILRLL